MSLLKFLAGLAEFFGGGVDPSNGSGRIPLATPVIRGNANRKRCPSFWNNREKRIQFSQDRVIIDGQLASSHKLMESHISVQ